MSNISEIEFKLYKKNSSFEFIKKLNRELKLL